MGDLGPHYGPVTLPSLILARSLEQRRTVLHSLSDLPNGETRTRTGALTIFSREARPL